LASKVEDLDVWAFDPQLSMSKVGDQTFSSLAFQFSTPKVGDLKSGVIGLQLLVLKIETQDSFVDEKFPKIFFYLKKSL
jgi:hypothetical protein